MLDTIIKHFGFFLIVFTRISGIFSMTPVFGSRNIPVSIKIGFGFFLTLVLFPLIENATKIELPETLLGFIAVIISEFLIGLIIGFASYMVFAAIQMAGGLIDVQIGFSIVSVLDPQSGTQLPILGTFKYVLAILLFLGTNGHHVLIAALSESFHRLPVGASFALEPVTNYFVLLFTSAFVFAFKAALPILVTLFLIDVAFGILARTVPQMNVFMVGMPAKLVVGLLAIVLILPVYFVVIQIGFTGMYSDLYRLLDILKPQ
jgi:flagellar biosynthetic protein FliR